MGGSRIRDSSFVPAIPDLHTVVYRDWFELHERVTAFEDREHELMRPSRGHCFKAPLLGQIDLFGGV